MGKSLFVKTLLCVSNCCHYNMSDSYFPQDSGVAVITNANMIVPFREGK